jgi:rubrerythrin
MITRRALITGTAASLVAAAPARAAVSGGDPNVLGLLLAVEQAQVALYARAASLPLHGRVAELAGRFGDEERKHAARLRGLGAKATAGPAPTFSFSKADDFLRLAQRLEGLAVGAYNGAIPQLRDPALFEAIAAMAQVEARHSAAIRVLRDSDPAPRAFDRAFEPNRAQHALDTLLAG